MMNSEDAKIKYADIINLPHHQSATRKRMSLYDRAAQFASYKALSGYEDMVAEEARLTDSELELSESETELINAMLCEIAERVEYGDHPAVSVTYFKPDAYKAGGRYETLTAVIKKIDAVSGKLVFYGSDDLEDRRVPPTEINISRVIRVMPAEYLSE